MKYIICALLVLSLAGTQSFAQNSQDGWIYLFNGKDLTGWNTYIGPPRDTSGKKISSIPVGLNIDPNHVFSVVSKDGSKVIRISGRETGGMSSKGEYSNYHLQVFFKWGAWKEPRRRKKDSGLLYHSVGENGADYDSWMRSQEFQIEEGNVGDYWGCAGGIADIPAIRMPDSTFVYNAKGALLTFSADSPAGRHCRKAGDPENASGQWNVLDLYCVGDTSIHVVNGKLVMVLYHHRQKEMAATAPLTRGKIQLQSEGAEVYYKNIRLQPITMLPKGIIN
jgi:hypothetical protein